MSDPFLIRRAQPADRAAVEAICRAIDPEDWVPDAFDDFVAQAEPQGLYVAQAGEHLFGCYHVELLAPGEVYFSAMRIDPAMQGRGLGTQFCRAQLVQARAAGAATVYLHSKVTNAPAHRTVLKNGFRNLGEWAIYWGIEQVAVQGKPQRARWATETDRAGIARHRASRGAAPLDGVISLPANPWVLRSEQESDWDLSGLAVVEGAGRLEGLISLYSDADGLYVRRLEGTPAAAADLLEFAVAQWRQLGKGGLHISLPAAAEPFLKPLQLESERSFPTFVFRWAEEALEG